MSNSTTLLDSPGLLSRWHKLTKGLLALVVGASFVASAQAHTVSIGYENAGSGALRFWYGTYHGNDGINFEGSFTLVGINGNSFPSTTVSFNLSTLTKPAGLIDGTTNFYANGSVLSATPYPLAVRKWQGVTFTGLAAGDYRFTYNPRVSPAPSATWAPINPAVNSSTVTVTVAQLIAAPNANAGPDVTVNQGDSVTLSALGSTDGNTPALPLTFSWTQLSGPAAVALSATNTATPTFTAPASPAVPAAGAALVFQVTVSNGASTLPGTDTVTVNVRGNSPPAANAGPDQPNVSAGANCTALVALAGSGSDSDGTVVSYSWTGPFGTASGQNPSVTLPIGVHAVTLTVTDDKGATGSDTVVITVKDTTPPSLTVPASIAVGNDATKCGANVSFTVTASDACSGVTVVTTPASGSFFPIGTTTVTSVATDGANNSTTKTFTVLVTDTEKPVIVASGNIVVGNDAGLCTATVSLLGAATASDNCAGVTVSYSPAGPIFAGGQTVVTATATDAAGNTASTTFTVTVQDREKPVIGIAATAKTVECDGAGNTAALAAWLASNGGATATDNCGSVTWSHNFNALSDLCGATGAATVTFTATDASGNSSSTTASFTIVDTTAPTITSNVRDFLPNEVTLVFTFTGQDLCGAANVTLAVSPTAINGAGKTIDKSGSVAYTIAGNQLTITDSGGVGTIWTITATAVDDCGNRTVKSAVANVLRPANEGVGNGVDGNTPGAAHNGNNDGPGTSPGNPGAKSKKG